VITSIPDAQTKTAPAPATPKPRVAKRGAHATSPKAKPARKGPATYTLALVLTGSDRSFGLWSGSPRTAGLRRRSRCGRSEHKNTDSRKSVLPRASVIERRH
jgi:hypothetical protein